MKDIILMYLKNDRTFDAGVKLYQQYGNNKAFKHVLNRQGNQPDILQLLHEQLRQLAGISEMLFKSIMSQPVSNFLEICKVSDNIDSALIEKVSDSNKVISEPTEENIKIKKPKKV